MGTINILQAAGKGSQRAFIANQFQVRNGCSLEVRNLRQILTPHLLIGHHRMNQIFYTVIAVIIIKLQRPAVIGANIGVACRKTADSK